MGAENGEYSQRTSSNYLRQPEELELEKDHGAGAGSSGENSDNESSEGLLKQERDLEAQGRSAPAVEHNVTLRAKLLFLAGWFFFNLALTISNKAVLGKVFSRDRPCVGSVAER